MKKIRVGIVGYGNLGRGVELSISQNDDMQLVGVFSRRDPSTVETALASTMVYHIDDARRMKDDIDVMILCGGSATDLPQQTPAFSAMFNTVDSFDTHAKIPEHFAAVDAVAREAHKISIISVGWDPGLFSLNRLYAEAIMPVGHTYTFWGKGVSQGHSDAIRRIPGVACGIQYTIPVQDSIDQVRSGCDPELATRQKHIRECFVVAAADADTAKIESEIKNMPNYFSDYDTIVHFISDDEFTKNHTAMPHGGFVIRSGKTGKDNQTGHIVEYSIKLDSNPEFTASVLVAYARAAARLNASGESGAKTAFDIAPVLLSPKSGETLRKELL